MKQFMLLILALFGILLPLTVGAIEGTDVEVTLLSQDPDPVEPGATTDLRFRIENDGGQNTGALQVELLPIFPLVLQDSAVKDIGSIDARQRGTDAIIVKYTVLADRSADERDFGVYLRYRRAGEPWVTAGPFNVSVQSAQPILAIAGAHAQPVSAGNITELIVQMRNAGKSDIKDVQVAVQLGSIPFAPVGMANQQVISSIPAGEMATARFTLIADPEADAAYYKTDVLLSYLDRQGKRHIQNATVGLLMNNEYAHTLALEEGTLFTSGSNGEVVLSISNRGPATMRFLSIELLENPAYRILSPPKVYLGNLDTDDFETVEYTIRSLEDGEGQRRSLPLNVELTYKDNRNQERVILENISLPLYTSSEASRFGLAEPSGNYMMLFFTVSIQLLVVIFIIFMLIDCWRNSSLPPYKKVLWSIVILTGIGAATYYFIARRKK